MKGIRGMALVLALVTAFSGVFAGKAIEARAAGNTPPGAPTELRTEMLEYAYGLNTKNPAFSWVVNDTDKDEVQSAYRILVSGTSALGGDVLDTGWVESAESSFVHADALAGKLADNELYYWQVQTKDKDGAESPLSEARPFMTGIGEEWQSLNGIWATPNAGTGEESVWTDYTVEQTMSITNGGALAVLLRMDGENNGYMAQIRANGSAAGNEKNMIKIQKINKKSPETAAFATLNLTEKSITLPADATEFGLKIQAEGTDFTFWIKTGAGEYIEAGTVSIADKGGITEGRIGYRTGRSEAGTISSLTVTGKNNQQIFSSPFKDGQFPGCTVTGGKLSVGNSAFAVCTDVSEGGESRLPEISRFSFFRSPKLDVGEVSKIDKAIVSSACRGTGLDRGIIYDIWMNGECLGAGSARELNNVGKYSGGAGYRQVYYNSYDVTELIKSQNDNVISALGNSRDEARSILVQMTVFYKDGTKKIVTNSGIENSGWKTLDGTNAFGNVKDSDITTGYVTLMHDNVNMEYYPVGWQKVEFDDSQWAPAKVTYQIADAKSGTSGNVLYPFSSENVLRVVADEPTKKVYVNDSGNVVVDLGKEIIGGMKVDLDSAKKQQVTVHMGEEMNSDGTVKWKLSAVPHYEDTWTLIQGKNQFETATMRNFRYVEFIGLDDATKKNMTDDPKSIMGWAMQQPFDETDSSFQASGGDTAAMLNRLYELSKYTIKATNQDVFVDSQARERAPYEGDLLVNSNTSYAVSGNYSLARHSNEWLMDNQTWPNDYRIFSVEMAYWDYIYTGNTDSIRECYNGLKNKMKAQIKSEDSATGLVQVQGGGQAGTTALIDWPTSERDGYQGSTYDVVMNSEYVGIYHDMAVICEALGQTGDAQNYQAKSDKLKETLVKYAYDQINGCFYDSLDANYNPTKHSSTHATAYALNYGVFENQAMADSMCEFVYNKCKDEFKGSVYVTYFILEGLYRGNHGEMAEAIMTNPKTGTDVKTYAALLDTLNCTITPEAWGHKWKGNMTMSHPWGAAPGCAIVQGMFGIVPTSAGFNTFEIKLQPGETSSAQIKAPTVKGPVEVSYTNGNQAGIKEGKIQATVTIPANTRAKVSIPIDNVKLGYLLVDGEKREAVNDGNYLSVELGSGTYSLAVDPTEVGYKPVLSVTASAAEAALIVGDTQEIQTKVVDQFSKEVTEDLEFTYQSSDENVLTVDEKGIVTATGVGEAKITVTAKYTGTNPSEASAEVAFTVGSVLKDFEVRLEADELEVGGTTQAKLVAVYADGQEEDISSDQVTFSAEGDVASVDANGQVTRLKEGDIVIKAVTAAKFDEVNSHMKNVELQVSEAYHFDGKTNPLNGAEIQDGKLYVKKGLKTANTDADKQGNVVSGKFIVENVAANVAFNAQATNGNWYFWQFRTDGSLKKHDKDNNVMGTTPITLKDGENSFRIATTGGKIYTWLNEELADICDTVAGMAENGGFGTRNGNSESAHFTELSTGKDIAYLITTTISAAPLPVIESVGQLQETEVEYGTPFEGLNLPTEVELTLSDGNTVKAQVTWEGNYDGNQAGTYTLTGKIEESKAYKNPSNLTASIAVEVRPIVLPVIKNVGVLEDIEVEYGTAFDELKLPKEVEITLDNEVTQKAKITWDKADYDGNVAKTYKLTGTIAESQVYSNPKKLTATVSVKVKEKPIELPVIESVGQVPEIEVEYGTPYEGLNLPTEVEITLSDGNKAKAGVTWDAAGYDGSKAGTYQLTGKIAESESYTNPDGLTASVNVKVKEKPEVVLPVIESVGQVLETEVEYGTPYEGLNLPTEVEITLSDGTKVNAAVTWDAAGYDGNQAGTYKLTGSIAESEGYKNPENLTASAVVKVKEKPAVVLPVIVSVGQLGEIGAVYGTPFEKLGLPAEVEVTLSDGTKVNAAVIWDAVGYDENQAGTYQLTGNIAINDGYENPDSLTAGISVKVDPDCSGSVEQITKPENNILNGILSADDKELPKVLDDEDIKAIQEDGAKVTVELSVTDITANVPEADRILTEETITKEQYEVGIYLDLSLIKTVGGKEPEIVKDTSGKGALTIQFTLSDGLINTNPEIVRTYKIVRIHNGEASILDTVLGEDGRTLLFETDRFSTYTVVYQDRPVNPEEPEKADKTILNQRIEEAKTKVEGDYTAETWVVFWQALEEAEAVSAEEGAKQEEVDEKAEELLQAMNALQPKTPDQKPGDNDDNKPGTEEKPGTGNNPGTGSKPGTGNNSGTGGSQPSGNKTVSKAPMTGDAQDVMMFMIPMLLAGGIAVMLMARRRRES